MGIVGETYFLIILICTSLNFGLPRAIAQSEKNLHYATNLQYNYQYETEVYFNEKDIVINSNAKNDVGFKFMANVQLSSIWNDHAKSEIHSVARSGQKHNLQILEKHPLYFTWDGNHVSKVFAVKSDEFWAVNMKIAISNLFQLHRGNIKRQEIDINGECDVEYKETGSQLTKTKRNCKKIHQEKEFYNVNSILDVGSNSNLKVTYDIQNGIIQSAVSSHHHSSWVAINPEISTTIVSKQILSFVNTKKGLSKLQSSSVVEAISLIGIKSKQELIEYQSTVIVPKVSCSG